MSGDILNIPQHVYYTPLVYGRIRKKLGISFSDDQIEKYISQIVIRASVDQYARIGKNLYLTDVSEGVRITIHAGNFRVITIDHLK